MSCKCLLNSWSSLKVKIRKIEGFNEFSFLKKWQKILNDNRTSYKIRKYADRSVEDTKLNL